MEKIKTIWDYFKDEFEYPKQIADSILPYNEVWMYVSSTFLNGFINYVEPIGVFLIDRYTPDNEDISDIKVDYKEKGSYKPLVFNGSKKDLKDKILSENIVIYHTNLRCFSDDIIIIAEIEHNEKDINKFMFFWFDMDVSDCCIGRFITTDSKEQVKESVINWLEVSKKENEGKTVEEHSDSGIINYTELPLSFISGWVKF